MLNKINNLIWYSVLSIYIYEVYMYILRKLWYLIDLIEKVIGEVKVFEFWLW